MEPALSSYKSTVYINDGEDITLQVHFEGTPKPTIVWFFDGIRLEEEETNGYEVMQDGALHISRVKDGHAGTYDFIVSNILGSVEGCTKLIVFSKERRSMRKSKLPRIDGKPISKVSFAEHVAKSRENNVTGFLDDFEVSYLTASQKILKFSYFVDV